MMRVLLNPKTVDERRPGGARLRSAAGFTMVEIAISLAIIAFALVAIIGVLPAGLKVQQENQDETIIDQDGRYWLEAIRGASKGDDDLIDHVEAITIRSSRVGQNPTTGVTFTNVASQVPAADIAGSAEPLQSAAQIIGLLSRPKFETLPNGVVRQNRVEAQVTAISGGAEPMTAENSDFAFRYRLQVEIAPFTNMPPALVGGGGANPALVAANLQQNLHEVRLTLEWPYLLQGPQGNVGRNRKTFRTLVSGTLRPVGVRPHELYFFEPDLFTEVK